MPNEVRLSGMKRAIIYCRVSTVRQGDEGTSLDSQEMEARQRAGQRGYVVTEVIREMHTGADLDGREGLTRARVYAR